MLVIAGRIGDARAMTRQRLDKGRDAAIKFLSELVERNIEIVSEKTRLAAQAGAELDRARSGLKKSQEALEVARGVGGGSEGRKAAARGSAPRSRNRPHQNASPAQEPSQPGVSAKSSADIVRDGIKAQVGDFAPSQICDWIRQHHSDRVSNLPPNYIYTQLWKHVNRKNPFLAVVGKGGKGTGNIYRVLRPF